MNIALPALYLLSAFVLPWWMVVPLGIVVATLPYGAPVAVFGGMVLDSIYGTPLTLLGGISYLYTLLFLMVLILIEALQGRIVD